MAVIKGILLGHVVARTGSTADAERTEAIVTFAPLKDATHIRQFIGCTNWIRWYLAVHYAVAAKILGEYMKPTVSIKDVAPLGLVHEKGQTDGDKEAKVEAAKAEDSELKNRLMF